MNYYNMATQRTPRGKQKLPTVYCGECQHFKRDTEGISHRLENGEYFMGVCTKGLTPDSPKKQFADKPRQCQQHNKSNN